MEKLIYLDNAATTFPKPPEVTNAACECMRKWCGNPGRGSHRLAIRASQALFDCREEAAALFGLENSDNVVITSNATYALNAAIFGLVGEGDHVIISDLEHNSVLRPVEFLRRSRGVQYKGAYMYSFLQYNQPPSACGGAGTSVPPRRNTVYSRRLSKRGQR